MSKSNCKVSVVIASLGGEGLGETVDSINRGTILPDEILICTPREHLANIPKIRHENARIITTNAKGQVLQRTRAFHEAANSLVMQLDDDVILSSDCLQLLIEALTILGPNAAVGPSILDIENKLSIYKRVCRSRILEHTYYRILNGTRGFVPGTITLAGVNIGWDPELSLEKTREVEWLAGGCVMHYRQNLILDNYFPFKGKAFCEDLIHSHFLRSRGIKLYIVSQAKCLVESVRNNKSNSPGLREFIAEYRARKYFVKIGHFSWWRIHIFYLLRLITFFQKMFPNPLVKIKKYFKRTGK